MSDAEIRYNELTVPVSKLEQFHPFIVKKAFKIPNRIEQ